MLTSETIHSCAKEDISRLTPTLEPPDLGLLVAWLSETDDNFRYKCFLLLQDRSRAFPDVYPFWDEFVAKLDSPNSYQRSLGLMLIAENARWCDPAKFEQLIDRYLSFCDDEKPITVRQCIQGLCKIVAYQPGCRTKIVDKLLSIDLAQRKETMRKSLLLDILSVLCATRKFQTDDRIEQYLHTALTGAILDPKSKKLVEAY